MSEANIAVALRFMQAMSTNDADLAERCLAPGAVALARGHGNFAGERPREVMIGAIAKFAELMPGGLNFTILDVTAGADRVAVEAEGNAVTATGAAYRNHYCFVMTIRDGKVSRVNEYFCTRHADEVLWPLFSAAGIDTPQ